MDDPIREFDDKAATWDDDPAKGERAEAVARLLLARIAPDPAAEVLDYGAGTGLLGFALAPRVGRVTFADPSEGMLEVLRRKLAERPGVEGRTLALDPDHPRIEGRYDLIASLMTLHHVPDVQAALEHFFEHLRPGGWLALCDLDTEDGSFHDGAGGVHHGFDRSDLAARLRRCGLEEVAVEDAWEIVARKEDGERRYPLFLARGRRPA